MQVKSIVECSHWSILQYFRPSLSYHLSLRSLISLFLSDRFTQLSLKSVYVLANSLDPDEMPLNATFHLGFHVLLKCAFRSHYYTKGKRF